MRLRQAKRKGIEKERAIVNREKALGRTAFRSAASLSPVDVVSIDSNNHTITLIQSKAGTMPQSEKDKLESALRLQFEGYYQVHVRVE